METEKQLHPTRAGGGGAKRPSTGTKLSKQLEDGLWTSL